MIEREGQTQKKKNEEKKKKKENEWERQSGMDYQVSDSSAERT